MAVGSEEAPRGDGAAGRARVTTQVTKETFLDALPHLLEELRIRGFSVRVEHHLVIDELLIGLAAQKAFPLRNKSALGQLLCPLFAKSPLQQEIFTTCFRDWLQGLPRIGIEGGANVLLWESTADENAKSVSEAAATEGRTLLKWRRRLGWLLLFLIVVVISVIAICGKLEFGKKFGQISPGPSPLPLRPSMTSVLSSYPQPPEKASDIPKNVVRVNLQPFVWVATFGVLFSLFLVAVLRRRLDLQLKRKITGDQQQTAPLRVRPPEPRLFQSILVAKTSYDLRRTKWVKQDQMDPEATLQATLRSGGFFTPVSFRRRVLPEYLALIDRRNYADHSSALTEALLDRLASDGLLLTIHYFDRSPRYCFPKVARTGSPRRLLSIDELADRHADSRLLLFADPLQILEPGSRRPQKWVQTLTELETPGLFVRQFDDLALRVHDVLRTLGFSVFPANQFGLRAYADFVTGQTDESNLHLTRAVVDPPFFSWFDRESAWLGHRQPRHSQVTSMVTHLRESLGSTGFLCLCACAIYPEIYWDLTVYLVTELSRSGKVEESPEELLGRLVALPWFRHARMPNWLRVQLIARIRPQQEKLIRRLIEDLLLTALKVGPEAEFTLPIAPTDPALRSTIVKTLIRGVARAESSATRVENPLREYVFVTFIESRLSVRLPPGIRHLVYSPDLAGVWRPFRSVGRFFAGEFGLLMKPKIALATIVAILIISTVASLTIPKLLPRNERRLLAKALGDLLTALNLSPKETRTPSPLVNSEPPKSALPDSGLSKSSRTTTPELPSQLKPILEMATLSIATEPPGASILLDGRPPQLPPNTFTHVPFGSHQLSATLDNYLPITEHLEVRAGMSPEIRLQLDPSYETDRENFRSLLRDAQLGDSNAMMKLGLLYLRRGTADDDVEGFNWLNRAYNAPNHNLAAGAYLADCYLSGKGTKQDVRKAEGIIMPLANQNVVPAMTLAGRILQFKADVIRSEAAGSASPEKQKSLEAQANELDRQSRQWWERAEKDDWNAAAHLGRDYEEGWGGVEKSEEQAESRYKAGVAHGNPLSMFFYGLMIEKKPGRREEAETLISRAAAAGLPSAIRWCKDNNVAFVGGKS